MLSPKMQRAVRVNDAQLVLLSERASGDNGTIRQKGFLQKRSTDSHRWQVRFFVLYQNLLFYYDQEHNIRPAGVIFLEGCYVDRIIAPSTTASSAVMSQTLPKNQLKEEKLQHAFSITFRKENARPYDLKAVSHSVCELWMSAIRDASFNKLLLIKEELEQKHVHLLQVVESEKTAKWQYTRQCDELTVEIKKLRAELSTMRREFMQLQARRSSVFSAAQMMRGSFGSVSNFGGGARGSFDTTGSEADGDLASLAGGEDGAAGGGMPALQDTVELRKIKKVQSFFRGWLCRRRWKQIVEEYIKSPHAESMRRRNTLVFSMVEAEEEYTEQLEVLVSCFYRPFKMAASAKRPPCSHEELSSIFLNAETVLFLHQIFLKGLTSRLESWPTLVLGDLFDMLLPMLSIYQEFVRNHHFSMQTLAECKNSPEFSLLLRRLEAKPQIQGRSIEHLLTAPMSQIPRYIVTLHELLAHTPHDHVERESLNNARQKLEDLSRQMHDEVSETENLRKNLAVERMIVEGCEILLDVNQVFVRQGSLVQVPAETKGNRFRDRLASFKSEKESVRQCYLFSKILIIATRTTNGRLNLLPEVGKIMMADASLLEDPSDMEREDREEEAPDSDPQQENGGLTVHNEQSPSDCSDNDGDCLDSAPRKTSGTRDFKIIIDTKTGGRHFVHLMASTVEDKQAWISDISQCIDNLHVHSGLVGPTGGPIAAHEALKTDPRLFKDDVDIRFSKTLNSCKLPQVRYATPERLLQRLIDLRFLSVDFLNTFLLTYRVFTDSDTVLNALQDVFYNPPADNDEPDECDEDAEDLDITGDINTAFLDIPGSAGDNGPFTPRRTSAASSVSGYGSEGPDRARSASTDSTGSRLLPRFAKHRLLNNSPQHVMHHLHHHIQHQNHLQQLQKQQGSAAVEDLPPIVARTIPSIPDCPVRLPGMHHSTNPFIDPPTPTEDGTPDEQHESLSSIQPMPPTPLTSAALLSIPSSNAGIAISSSLDTLVETSTMSGPSSPSNLSSVTLVGSTGSGTTSVAAGAEPPATTTKDSQHPFGTAPTAPLPERIPRTIAAVAAAVAAAAVPPIFTKNPEVAAALQPAAGPESVVTYSLPPTVTTTHYTETASGELRGQPAHLPPPFGGVAGSLSATPSGSQASAINGGRRKSSAASMKSCIQLDTQTSRRPSTETTNSMSIPHAALSAHRHSLQLAGGSRDHGGGAGGVGADHGSLRMGRAGSEKGPQPSGSSSRLTGRGSSSKTTPEKIRKALFGSREPRPGHNVPHVLEDWLQGVRRRLDNSLQHLNRRFSESDDDGGQSIYGTPRGSVAGTSQCTMSPRSSMQLDPIPICSSKAGVVITSYRQSKRSFGPSDPIWSSTSTAAAAFAIATSASSNPRDEPAKSLSRNESVVSSPATMRVLNVMRHWVSKHFQDFEQDQKLRTNAINFLENISCSTNLLPSEHRAAAQLIRLLTREDFELGRRNIEALLTRPMRTSVDNIETLSALEIAEQMTYLDHQIFMNIRCDEFLGQKWMKASKKQFAENIIHMTKRFNDGSRLICSEIMSRENIAARVAAIEKWTAVGDICKCLHNLNGVLQVCSAFMNAAVYRLRKTWDKVPKSFRQMIDKMQSIVSSDGRFRCLRETLHCSDPPCIPYLGMYLTDLNFIEEGTPDFTPDGLLNFSKMRMISHVIREIRHFQQIPYRIRHIPRVTAYLLDQTLLLDDDTLYRRSMEIEPRTSRLSVPNTQAV